MNVLVRRWIALWCWTFLTWALLTWTLTAEQEITGALLAALIATALTPLGTVVGPWVLLHPRRLVAVLRLAGSAAVRIVGANLSLSRRIWSPSRPLRSGMVVVPTSRREDGDLAAVALLTSVIVDNQIVDLDRRHHVLQYHAVDVPPRDPEKARAAINGPVERLIAGVRGESDG